MPNEDSRPRLKRLSVDLTPEKHRFLKATAASMGLSIRELTERVFEPDVLTQVIELMIKPEVLTKAG